MSLTLFRKVSMICLVILIGLSGLGTNSYLVQKVDAAGAKPYIGEIQLFPYNGAPSGWMYAAGQNMSITQNTALFSLLGVNYGGDGKSTFALPDLTDAAPEGMGYYISINGEKFPSREEGMYGAGNAVLGEVRLFPYYFTPSGWLAADGQDLPISQYKDLYQMIGTTFGGDGLETFRLPTLPKIKGDIIHYAISVDPTYHAENRGTDYYEYIGEIIPLLVKIPLDNWALADGSLLATTNNQPLFSLIGNKFGGNGLTDFKLPQLNSDQSPLVYYVSKTGVFPSVSNNPLPNAVEDRYTTKQNTPLTINSPGLLENDRDSSAAVLRSAPLNGTLTLNANGSFVYTPNNNYVGNDSFTYSATNQWGTSDPSLVTITVEPGIAPIMSGVADGGVYNQTVIPTFDSGTALLNEVEFTSGTAITADGDYTLAVTNGIGTTTIHFTIDSQPPIVTGIVEGGVYSVDPVITFNEGTATLNGSLFLSGDTVRSDGEHVLIVTDRAGNTTTIPFSFYSPRIMTFNSNGGTDVMEQKVPYGDKAIAPPDPTKAGHTFAGWFTDSDLSQAFDFSSTTVTTTLTLYAKWTVNSYTITFDPNGGTAVADHSVNYGQKLSAPASPSRSGYTFAGWYADPELKTPFNFAQTEITADLTLYAKWSVNSTPPGGSDGNSNGGGSGNQNNNGSSSTPSLPNTITNPSTNGRLTLAAGQAGRVSLGDGITVTIPAGATNQEMKITIDQITDSSDLLTNQTKLISPVYELLKNVQQNFNKYVTLNLTFDTSSLPTNHQAGLFYFDEQNKLWISAGEASIHDNQVNADVDHFTKFAVFAVEQPKAPAEIAFSDVEGHWAEDFIQEAVREGIVSGFSDGSFKPNASITRAEFTVMLVNTLNTEYTEEAISFTDQAKIGAWAQSAVARAVQAGFIQGDNEGAFRPNDAVTRAEMAVLVAGALQLKAITGASSTFADDAQIPLWAKAAVADMQKAGMLHGKGLNTFAPSDKTTRAEAVKLLLNAKN
ncbi:tail fiber protein [Paenibacillus xylanexedens]|uniref:tail fiber protein n=1 Tax=Paenibacillus xylanexedens TaxID=528191 RepID=UPI001F2B6EF6|nr:tail fiber protein [Paenibacillus xylanexedens]